MYKVLMICHGNICRSTMAEFVLKDMVKKRNIADNFEIASAGTCDNLAGSDTHIGTKVILTKAGIPFTKRGAQKITVEQYNHFDYLLYMDKRNYNDIMPLINGDPDNKLFMMLEPHEIADPWFQENDLDFKYYESLLEGKNDIAAPMHFSVFDKAYEEITKGCNLFLDKLNY